MNHFQGGVDLVDVQALIKDQGIHVDLLWHASETLSDDYTVFVHYLRDDQRMAQADAQPASGYYPTSRWRAGDLIHDTHVVSLSDQPEPTRDRIMIGWYRPGDDDRLNVLDHAGNPAGNSITIPIREILH
jgi:hypothetical protein